MVYRWWCNVKIPGNHVFVPFPVVLQLRLQVASSNVAFCATKKTPSQLLKCQSVFLGRDAGRQAGKQGNWE